LRTNTVVGPPIFGSFADRLRVLRGSRVFVDNERRLCDHTATSSPLKLDEARELN
jgi:hypothetical protein